MTVGGKFLYRAPEPLPVHRCDLPKTDTWKTDQGGAMEHVWLVHAGSTWQCDMCQTIWEMGSNQWLRFKRRPWSRRRPKSSTDVPQ